VIGVGVGWKQTGGRWTGEFSVVALVTRKISKYALSSSSLIPSVLGNVKTDIIETGVIKAPPTPMYYGPVDRTQRLRPAPGGCSIGHVSTTAGTLGCLVSRRGEVFVLSNNHVLANENRASRGDPILQPGPHDRGRHPADQIASLEHFVQISFGYATNRVDAAIAKPLTPPAAYVTPYVLGIGAPASYSHATLGTRVVKSGRTTALTRGTIFIINATLRVQYSSGWAVFENQLVTENISKGGDSGSVVFLDDGTRSVCGLLFAGSDIVSVMNPIEDVINQFNVSIP